jgi:DNA-binding protein H-NS
MTNINLSAMTPTQLVKLQAEIADNLARRSENSAKTAEAILRDEVRSDLERLAQKWGAKVEQVTALPAHRTAPNGHKKAATTGKGRGAKVAPKYRDDQGHIWSGRGKQPRWLTQRLQSGAKIEDFRVSA